MRETYKTSKCENLICKLNFQIIIEHEAQMPTSCNHLKNLFIDSMII